jgi:hypothetical protein
MSPIVDDKKFSTDTRSYRDGILAEGFVKHFDESPISKHLLMKDICIYKPGVRKTDAELNGETFDPNNMEHFHVSPDLNKIGKNGKTSWDSFSYALLMGHNVWMHLEAVQRANREYDAGSWPAMMRNNNGDHAFFKDIVEAIFATPDRAEAEAIIAHYDRYWQDIIGTRGFKGKKAVSGRPMFDNLFEVVEEDDGTDADEVELDETKLDELETQ